MKILNETGLARLVAKIKATFIPKTDIVTANTLDIDNTPTNNSNNLVKSGGVYSALSNKQNVIDNSNKLPYSLISGTPTIPTYSNGSGLLLNNYVFSVDTNTIATKEFVNSSISTNTAYFLGTLDVVTDLGLSYGATTSAIVTALNSYTFTQTKTNNDYCYVVNKDSNNNTIYQRFKWTSSTSTFNYEYTLNNSSFTTNQWNAINSGITSSLVSDISSNTSARHTHNNKSVLDGITSADITNWNNKSTFSGSYNDLTNKPTIPVVPTNISAFTNDAGYLTQHQSLANYYTKTEIQNGYQPKITSSNKLSYNLISGTPDLSGYATLFGNEWYFRNDGMGASGVFDVNLETDISSCNWGIHFAGTDETSYSYIKAGNGKINIPFIESDTTLATISDIIDSSTNKIKTSLLPTYNGSVS